MSSSGNSEHTGPLASTGDGKSRSDTILLPDSGAPDTTHQIPSGRPEPASTLHVPDPARLAILSNRYDILSEAGHGSMGDVYKARDRETGEVVALKLLKPEIASDQTMIERFKNELLFARKITHKNVCRMYDFNRIDEIAYTSMEYVEGESLRSALNRFGGLAVRKARNVALQICSGLKEAHAQGIVHRDLKPENVMIDPQGNVKIMDFGIARSMEAATRLTGSMMGTPAYMAPEQVTGKLVDYRTDVYALGLILYEMFTGVQACQAETPVAAAMKQLRETPPLPHDIDPTIPIGIERAILKCLEKEPAKRFQSVADLEKALSAPGVTGTSPGLAAVLPALLPPPEPTKAPVKQATTRSAVVAQRRRLASPLLWTLFGALLVFAAMAGAHWVKVARTSKLIPPPASTAAPNPPVLASKAVTQVSPAKTRPAPTAAIVHVSRKTKPTATKLSVPANPSEMIRSTPSPLTEENSKPPINTAVFPRVERPVKKSARQIELETAPADVQQHADKAFGASGNPIPADPSATQFVWVGRYERKERGKEVAQTIRNLGLPANSIARHRWNNTFWVVVAGPFPQKRAPDVVNWLKAQGFKGARELRVRAGTQSHQTQRQ